MTDLQMILLISSGAFLAGLYWWGKKTKEQNTLRPHHLKRHGFRADTPEEEGAEVRVSEGRTLDGRPQTAPAVDKTGNQTITAREAWDRASGQQRREPTIGNLPEQSVEPSGASAASIQGVMSNHSDTYLEERFALSEPVTPKNTMQQPANMSSGRQSFPRDYGAHHLGASPISGEHDRADSHHQTSGSHHADYAFPEETYYDTPLHDRQEHYLGHDSAHRGYAPEQNNGYHRGHSPNQGQQPSLGQVYGHPQPHSAHNRSHDHHHDHHHELHEYHEHHDGHHHHAHHDHHYDDYDGYDDQLVEQSLPAQIFALLVLDPRGGFTRKDIHHTMLGAGLSFSTNGIYVFYDKAGSDSHYIFRVANVNDTGYFPDPEDQPEEFTTNGVALILELPNVVTPYRAMNEFITAARRISQNLGGNLYDANRRLIKESHLREMREYAQSIT